MVYCAACGEGMMDIGVDGDSWAACEIDDLHQDLEEAVIMKAKAEASAHRSESLALRLQSGRKQYEVNCKEEAMQLNKPLAEKVVALSNVVDLFISMVSVKGSPTPADLQNLNRKLKEGGYKPI